MGHPGIGGSSPLSGILPMEVYIDFQNKKVHVKAKTVSELLKKLNINPTIVVVAKGNEIVAENSPLHESDKIRIISVVSGG